MIERKSSNDDKHPFNITTVTRSLASKRELTVHYKYCNFLLASCLVKQGCVFSKPPETAWFPRCLRYSSHRVFLSL